MALESVSNVKNVLSHFNGKKGDDDLKAAQLESSVDEVDEEDLEDGEILDDEEEANAASAAGTECPPIQPLNQAPVPADTDAVAKQCKPDTSKSGEGRSSGSSRRKADDHDDSRHKRDRHKHHKKRHREGDEDGPRDGKRAKRTSSRKERHSEEENDEEMMFVRGASPSCNSNSPKMQEHFSQFGGDAGHYEYDSENDDGSNSPNLRGDSNRGNTRRRRGSGGPRSGGRNSSDRTNSKRKDGPSSRRGTSHMDKKRECMFYSQGKCQKGDDCPYLHSICPSRKLELCKFYLMDCCAKKDKCLYMHSDFPCKFYHTGMKCFSSDRCKFSHEPLTDSTRQILLKHIETAPKEILGEFPRLPRNSSGEVILPEPIAQDDSPPPSQLPSGQQKKIPSLFEIEIKPPPELSNLLNENTDEAMETPDDTRHAPAGRGHRTHAMPRPGGFYHERNSPRSEEDEDEEEEDSEEDNFETQLRKCMEAQRLERERKEREEGTHDNKKVDSESKEIHIEIKQEIKEVIPMKEEKKKDRKENEETKPVQKEKTPPPVSKVKTEVKQEVVEQSEVAAKAERQRRQLEADQAEEDDEEDEDQLVMATFDEEDTDEVKIKSYQPTSTRDEESSGDTGDEAVATAAALEADEDDDEEDGGSASEDDDVPIPKHLPKKQRELFLRIQQQQAQRAAAAAAEAADIGTAKLHEQNLASKKQDELDKVSDKDEENMEEIEDDFSLPTRDEDWYSSDDEVEEEKTLMKNILKNLSKQPSNQCSPATDAEECSTSAETKAKEAMDSNRTRVMEQLNLSNINITDDISRLLSSIRSTASKSETKPAVRDPRLSRDPRSRDSSGHTDTKTVATESKLKDTDLRMLPTTKDLDLRKPPVSTPLPEQATITKSSQLVDTDLRQRCYGDTDLRSVSMLGLPFKPVPLHVPCTEIDASISSHPPVQFKLIPADIKCPDYSDLKLDFSDPHVRNDPRLKKLVLQHDETISPMSPPPCEAPRVDPRSRSTSSDPRLARMTSSAVPPTTVIPINPLLSQSSTVGQMENAGGLIGGITRTQENVLIPQVSPGLNPQLGAPSMLHARPVLLENPLNRSEAPGLLGISPLHNILMEGNLGMINDPASLPRQGLLGPAPPLPPMQKEDDYDSHKGYGGPGSFRGPRRGRGGGNWERRGGRGRGPRSGNWDRDRRRNRRDYDRHDRSPSRHDRQYSPPPRRGSRSFSPSRADRYNSPNRDDTRRHRYSPSRDYSPQRGHSRSSGSRFSPSDSGSFTPPRRSSGSFTPPRNESGSFTPPQ